MNPPNIDVERVPLTTYLSRTYRNGPNSGTPDIPSGEELLVSWYHDIITPVENTVRHWQKIHQNRGRYDTKLPYHSAALRFPAPRTCTTCLL